MSEAITQGVPVVKVVDNNYYAVSIECAVRRKPGMEALPGQDPAERIYRIGSSLDRTTRSSLKGISGELELRFMPEIIGVSPNDPTFRRSINEYWSSISRAVPHDEDHLKEHLRGIPIKLKFNVLGKARKEKIDSTDSVEEKINILNSYLPKRSKTLDGSEGLELVQFFSENTSDYLLLNYCLKYSKVANNLQDVDKSPNIDFYIFEKQVSIKNQLTAIERDTLAIQLYQTLSEDQKLTNAVLLLFKESPKEFDSETDKLLKIYELYNLNPINKQKFINYVQDRSWKTRYLIDQSLEGEKLRKLPNSDAIYYGDLLIGLSVEDAILFLDNETKGKEIKQTLIKHTEL